MPFVLGNTFINSEAPNLPSHLWVVIAVANPSGEIAIVNFTSAGGLCSDTSCVVQPGEHAFVKHETVVNYRDAKIVGVQYLAQLCRLVQPHDDASPELLERIRQGALDSRFTPKKVLRLLQP